MTRNEALNKVVHSSTVGSAEAFISTLEALGLIKFDEEKIIDSPSMVIRSKLIDHVLQPMQAADRIVNALYAAGYKIIRK